MLAAIGSFELIGVLMGELNSVLIMFSGRDTGYELVGLRGLGFCSG